MEEEGCEIEVTMLLVNFFLFKKSRVYIIYIYMFIAFAQRNLGAIDILCHDVCMDVFQLIPVKKNQCYLACMVWYHQFKLTNDGTTVVDVYSVGPS